MSSWTFGSSASAAGSALEARARLAKWTISSGSSVTSTTG